jgi:hypothetical protein
MPYEMQRVFVKYAQGNKVYPPPMSFTDEQGKLFEISQLPLYVYMPVWVDDPPDNSDGR